MIEITEPARTAIKTAMAVLEEDIPRATTVASWVPEQLADIAEKALQRNPDDRFQSARAMGKALRSFIARSGAAFEAAEIAEWMRFLFNERRKRDISQLSEVEALQASAIAALPSVARNAEDDEEESQAALADAPTKLAKTIADLRLRYVVITSVDRDDLKDGGAGHFADCIREIRARTPDTRIEVLVPDFRGRMDPALEIFNDNPPDVFNHNLETAPRLYKQARPGSDYQWSLDLLKRFGELHPEVPTKSGLMLGLGEEIEEILQVMRDLRAHGVQMLTLGQYLQPSKHHLPVARYVTPEEFDDLRIQGEAMGFSHVASGPMVRSSYHADLQAEELLTA